jgi:hypothetical protein
VTAANEALVIRYLEARRARDEEVWGACMADDIVRYGPRPTSGLEPVTYSPRFEARNVAM